MNLQSVIRFCTATRAGRFLSLGGAAVLSIVVVRGCRPEPTRTDSIEGSTPTSIGEVLRAVPAFPTAPRRAEPSARTNPAPVLLPPIRWTGSNAITAASGSARSRLPSRRLLPCRLVTTVDSFSPETPIIGQLTEDVYFRGELMIPKNTEVHARAQAVRFRDRIASQGTWTFIWGTGEELTVNGLALDRDHNGDHWGVTDGSYGLHGSPQRSDTAEEARLFLATFLSGISEPFKERQATAFGFQLAPTAQNAALSGVGEVIDTYAKRLLANLERESVFIRVPAGRTFYLYTLDTIQPPPPQP